MTTDTTPSHTATDIEPEQQSRWFVRHRAAIGLFVLLSLALALRLYGINWDQGGLFHPDERAFLGQVDAIEFPEGDEWGLLLEKESPLNPGSFNWGSLPHYMLKAVQYGAAPFASNDWNLYDLRYSGRALSAIADTVTVLLVYLIGARWFSRRVGFLAAGMAALAVINIQLSHFFAVDTFLTMFIVATVYFSARVAYSGKLSDSALVGLMAGFGLATKFSIAPLAVAVVTGFLIYALSQPGESFSMRGWKSKAAALRQWQAFKGLMVAGVVTLAAVIVTQPYMFIDFDRFMSDIGTQGEMVRRIVDFPFTRQYEDTPKYWYQIWQTGFWGLGPVMGLVSWLGLVAVAAFAWFSRRKVDIVMLAWVLPYLLITGWFDVKFMRYMAPLVPFLVLYGARLLLWLGDMLRALWPRRQWLVWAPAAVVLVFTAQYVLAFMNVYNGLHPAQAASEWLAQNAAPGSRVVQEHWEEGTPRASGIVYVHDQLALYDHDSFQKFQQVTNLLSTSDYLIFYSNRLYGTIPRLPERYPLSTTYYTKLFDGSLGYELAFANTRPVRALGVAYYENQFVRVPFGPPAGFEPPSGALLTIAPGWADESFSVYEHPQVLILQNTGRFSAEQMLEVLGLPATANGSVTQPGLLLDPADAATQQEGGTWTEVAFLRNLPEGASWVVWLFAVELMALLALPLAFIVFRPFPDRGYLLAKPLGLLIAATFTWLLASLELVKFSFAGAALGLLFLGLVSGLIAWKRWPEMTAFYRQNRRLVLLSEGVFLLAFMSFLAIRMANPDLWHPFRGGEKPMDFAYLNAVIRSSVMPPYDPWFAGGFLNYYYFGQFLIADLVRLTGITPAVAYNLAVPLLFAFTFAAAFSIIYNLTALTITARRGEAAALNARSPVVAGIVAAALVAVAGNIDGLVQVAENVKRTVFDDLPGQGFDFWRSSRLFEPGSPGNEITEFPFFSFLFADLHAHMIAIPFGMLAAALAIAVFLRAGEHEGIAQRWVRLAVLGIAIGALRIINAWDFPTQLLIAGAATIGGEMFMTRRPVSARLAGGLLKWIFVAAVGYVVYLPFHLSFELFNNGVLQSEFKTPLWRYFAVHSVFLVIVLSWLFFEFRDYLPRLRTWLASYAKANDAPVWAIPFIAVMLVAALLTFAFTQWGTLTFTALLALAVLAAAAAAYFTHRPGSRIVLAVCALVAMAMAIGGGVDIFTVKDDIGRMNTVFKFYLQAWWLLALASGYFLWLMWSAGRLSFRRLSPPRALWMTAVAVFAIGVLVYPVLGTQARLRDRFTATDGNGTTVFTGGAGLNGMAYMDGAVQFERGFNGTHSPVYLENDRRAIEWLQRNVEGSPVIVEGLTDLYRWGNRVSIYTGLPAVIGWDWHQRQQRVNYAWAVMQRRQEVDDFYRTPSTLQARQFLDRYGVEYVYLGELERLVYPELGLAKFDQMQASGLTPVYEDGPVTIYRYAPVTLVAR